MPQNVTIDSTFAHRWQAEVLPARPLILPRRQFVYPVQVEEVERGALEVMVRPPSGEAPFLATCALGFADPAVPTGVWACPDPDSLCVVAGGYAYLIHTNQPDTWQQVEYRPVTTVKPILERGLLIFSGFHSLQAWGRTGKQWQTSRLTWDGIRITEVRGETLYGFGWEMKSDRELEFAVDLRTGRHSGGGYLP